MIQEWGITTTVNYDTEIPEEMMLQIPELTDSTQKDDDNNDEESDQTIIYDASEFEQSNRENEESLEDSEKSQKGQLATRTFGIRK